MAAADAEGLRMSQSATITFRQHPHSGLLTARYVNGVTEGRAVFYPLASGRQQMVELLTIDRETGRETRIGWLRELVRQAIIEAIPA
jgi:hypothetical protein